MSNNLNKDNIDDIIIDKVNYQYNYITCDLYNFNTQTVIGYYDWDDVNNEMRCYFNNGKIFSFDKNIFIKIDCQGAEIPILKGSKTILNKTDFILLEMPLFGKYNEGIPNFLEHIQFMDSIGFCPFDIIDNHYINNFNMQIDMLFINKLHKLNNVVQQKLYK